MDETSKRAGDADHETAIAERVRNACIDEAIRAWEDAGISGLCHEGRFEVAISALRMLEIDTVLRSAVASRDGQTPDAP